MSTIASIAPTSWKWTFSIGTPCAAASARPKSSNVAEARRKTRSGSFPPSSIRTISG
jgi:hypothetical protein